MARDGRETWVKRVARWRDSGLTAKEFAAEMGINANTLAHWSWQLRDQQTPLRATRRRGKAPEPQFVEVVAPVAAAQVPPAAKVDPLELVLHDGLCLRVPVHFDADALRRVVAVLVGR